MARSKKSEAVQQTTAQSLGSLITSARKIMRKDKGLNGDLDRLPLLTWIMFLKFLDDLELQREQEEHSSACKPNPLPNLMPCCLPSSTALSKANSSRSDNTERLHRRGII